MLAPRQMPLVQREWQRVAGNALETLVTGPKRGYAFDGGHRFDRDRGFGEQTAPRDSFVQSAPALVLERPRLHEIRPNR